MLLLPWKYASIYILFRHIPKLFYSYTGSKQTKNIHSSIASSFCCAIKLQIYITTSINISKRKLGIILSYGLKKRRERIKEDKCPNIKNFQQPKFSQILQSSREV
jgi:hypothetical protein